MSGASPPGYRALRVARVSAESVEAVLDRVAFAGPVMDRARLIVRATTILVGDRGLAGTMRAEEVSLLRDVAVGFQRDVTERVARAGRAVPVPVREGLKVGMGTLRDALDSVVDTYGSRDPVRGAVASYGPGKAGEHCAAMFAQDCLNMIERGPREAVFGRRMAMRVLFGCTVAELVAMDDVGFDSAVVATAIRATLGAVDDLRAIARNWRRVDPDGELGRLAGGVDAAACLISRPLGASVEGAREATSEPCNLRSGPR